MTPDELKKEFAKVISNLPEDKRNELYSKLKSLPDDEREKAIRSIVSKSKKANSIPSYPEATRVSVKKVAPNNSVKKSQKKKPKKHLKSSVKRGMFLAGEIVVLIMAILVGIFALNKFGVFDKDEKSVDETSVETTVAVETTVITDAPTPSPTPTPTPLPTPTPIPDGNEDVDLTGLTIVLDAGHQAVTSDELETCASWLGNEKVRCTSGTTGVNTEVSESELTLDYVLILGEYLEQKGATVVYTRTENDVDVSNQERATIAVENEADLFIRIHADAANDSKTSGVRVYIPDTGSYTGSATGWATTLGELVSEAEGLEFIGVKATNQYTGLNYANSVPSFQICLGYLSNAGDEELLLTEDNKLNVVYAITDFCSEFV